MDGTGNKKQHQNTQKSILQECSKDEDLSTDFEGFVGVHLKDWAIKEQTFFL
jgi:hypothetical protein